MAWLCFGSARKPFWARIPRWHPPSGCGVRTPGESGVKPPTVVSSISRLAPGERLGMAHSKQSRPLRPFAPLLWPSRMRDETPTLPQDVPGLTAPRTLPLCAFVPLCEDIPPPCLRPPLHPRQASLPSLVRAFLAPLLFRSFQIQSHDPPAPAMGRHRCMGTGDGGWHGECGGVPEL
jgi:hypothetical protein